MVTSLSARQLAELKAWAEDNVVDEADEFKLNILLRLLEELEAWKRTANTLADRLEKQNRKISQLYWRQD